MVKIYLNTKTGEIWASSLYKRKPPEGYVELVYESRGNIFPRKWTTIFCPVCKKYHFYYSFVSEFPKSMLYKFKIVEKYGCHISILTTSIYFNLYTRDAIDIIENYIQKYGIEKLEELRDITKKYADLVLNNVPYNKRKKFLDALRSLDLWRAKKELTLLILKYRRK